MNKGKGLYSKSILLNKSSQLRTSSKLKNKGIDLSSKKISINSKSIRQKEIETSLNKVYSNMDSDLDKSCSGCGSSIVSLTHSHIIPRSRRRDLITERDNITYHCIDCHNIWEHGPDNLRKLMKDYNNNMNYIQSVDREYYNLLTLEK